MASFCFVKASKMDQLIPNTGLGCSEQMAGFVASYGVKNNLCRADREKSINRNSAKSGLITLCLWGPIDIFPCFNHICRVNVHAKYFLSSSRLLLDLLCRSIFFRVLVI